MEAVNLFLFYSCPRLRVRRDFGLWTLVTVGTVTILWTLEVKLNVFHIMSNIPELMRGQEQHNKKWQFGCKMSPKNSGVSTSGNHIVLFWGSCGTSGRCSSVGEWPLDSRSWRSTVQPQSQSKLSASQSTTQVPPATDGAHSHSATPACKL